MPDPTIHFRRTARQGLSVVLLLLAVPLNAATITATYIGPDGGSWDNPANWDTGVVPDNWTGGGPTDVVIPAGPVGFEVVMDHFHTVDSVTTAGTGTATLRLSNDLRVVNHGVDLPIVLDNGADLILIQGNPDFIADVSAGAPMPGRTPRLTLGPLGPILGGDIRGPTDPNVAPLVVESPNGTINASATASGTRFHDRVLIASNLVAYNPLSFLGEGGVLDAWTTLPTADLVWDDRWALGPNGRIDAADYGLTTILGGAYADAPALNLDLSRIDFGNNSNVIVRGSLTLSQFRDIRSRAKWVTIENRLPQEPDAWPPLPFSAQTVGALDLEGQTVELDEFAGCLGTNRVGNPDNCVAPNSDFVFANGTITAADGGPLPSDLLSDVLQDVTLVGGIDATDILGNDNTGFLARRDVTIADGPVTATSLDGSDVRLNWGPLPEFNPDASGVVTLRNVSIPSHVFIDSYTPLIAENGLTLDGEIVMASSGDNFADFTFRGTQTLGGSGLLFLPTDSATPRNESRLIVEDGDLTIGPEATLAIGGYGATFHPEGDYTVVADDNHFFVEGELRFSGYYGTGYGLTFRPSRVAAGGIQIDDGGTLRIDEQAVLAEVPELTLSPGARLEINPGYEPIYLTSPTRLAALEVTGSLGIDGATLAISALDDDDDYEAGVRILLLDAGTLIGQFHSVELLPPSLSPQLPVNEAFTWAVLYETNRVAAEVALIGDANLNQLVEQNDLNAVLGNWGRSNSANPNAQVSWVTGDLNQDGIVDQGDLNLVLGHWGDAAAPDFTGYDVPEPGGAAALLLGVSALTRRQRADRR